MESLDKKTAEKRVSDITKTPQKHVYAINKDNRKGSQYVHRLAGDIIDHFLQYNRVPDVVSFLSKIPAEDAEEARLEIEKECRKMNKFFTKITPTLNACEEEGKDFEFVKFVGHLPQALDKKIEPRDSLIEPIL